MLSSKQRHYGMRSLTDTSIHGQQWESNLRSLQLKGAALIAKP